MGTVGQVVNQLFLLAVEIDKLHKALRYGRRWGDMKAERDRIALLSAKMEAIVRLLAEGVPVADLDLWL